MGYAVGEFTKAKKSTMLVAPITSVDERPIIDEEEKVQLAEYLSEKINEFDENQSIIRVEEEKEDRRQMREEEFLEFEDDDKDVNGNETIDDEEGTEEVVTDETEDGFEDGAEESEDGINYGDEPEDAYEDEEGEFGVEEKNGGVSFNLAEEVDDVYENEDYDDQIFTERKKSEGFGCFEDYLKKELEEQKEREAKKAKEEQEEYEQMTFEEESEYEQMKFTDETKEVSETDTFYDYDLYV